uniref:Uncharacterized protein n=1 Tax=Rhizophora mucronata TaxID=61149 RepID=A0A2P2N3Q8_RHIMU
MKKDLRTLEKRKGEIITPKKRKKTNVPSSFKILYTFHEIHYSKRYLTGKEINVEKSSPKRTDEVTTTKTSKGLLEVLVSS